MQNFAPVIALSPGDAGGHNPSFGCRSVVDGACSRFTANCFQPLSLEMRLISNALGYYQSQGGITRVWSEEDL